jgi:hypothetical protein
VSCICEPVPAFTTRRFSTQGCVDALSVIALVIECIISAIQIACNRKFAPDFRLIALIILIAMRWHPHQAINHLMPKPCATAKTKI